MDADSRDMERAPPLIRSEHRRSQEVCGRTASGSEQYLFFFLPPGGGQEGTSPLSTDRTFNKKIHGPTTKWSVDKPVI